MTSKLMPFAGAVTLIVRLTRFTSATNEAERSAAGGGGGSVIVGPSEPTSVHAPTAISVAAARVRWTRLRRVRTAFRMVFLLLTVGVIVVGDAPVQRSVGTA